MLDWFISKVSLLIFVVAIVGVLFAFSSVELGLLSQGQKVQAANGLARLVDSVCENCTISYSLDKNYTVSIGQNKVVVEGVERYFISQAEAAGFSAKDLRIYKTGGIVHVAP